MKVLALQGSPRGKAGVTDRVLKEFLGGAAAAGADCETIYLAQKKILPCTGEFHCWAVTPGRCINAEKDDVVAIHELMKRADVWVFATPLYVDSMTGQMKTFLDRSLPLFQPYFRVSENDECYHPWRESVPGKRIVLLAVNGFYERSHFEPLVLTFRRITRNLQGEWAGAVLRPHGWVLATPLAPKERRERVMDALAQAGRELVEEGRISEETQEKIGIELVSKDEFLQAANAYWDRALARGRL